MLRVVGILLALAVLPVQSAEVRYEGRSVVAVLEELRSGGLGLIYNTQLVPQTLRVLEEPRARTPRELLLEILTPHGLTLSPVAENLFAVVALPAAAPADPRVPSASAAAVNDSLPTEVIVNSSRYELSGVQGGSHTVFTREQVENMPRLGDESLRAVQRLPGAASNGISGLARIRGGEENESQIVLNGLALYEPFHLKNFFGPVSLLDSRLIGGIDVYTGGYTVEYGDRMSAVIDVDTRPASANNSYELGFSAFHTNALASGPFDGGRGTWLASVRRSNLDALAQFIETNYGEPHYFDGFARATYTISPATRLAINVLGSHDSVTALTNDERERSEVDYVNQYLWAELEHDSPGALRSRFVASLTGVDNDRRGTVDDPAGVLGQVTDERRFRIFGLRYDGRLAAERNARLQHRWGLELRALEADYRYSSAVEFSNDYRLPLVSIPPPARSLSRDFDLAPDGEAYAAWWSTRMRLRPRLTAELGLRWDAQSYTGRGLDGQFSPRMNLLFKLNDDTNLRASWGRYFQSQGIHELQVEDGVDTFFPAQRADHMIVSVEQRLPWQTQLRVEIYRKDYSRLRTRYENLFDPLVLLPELQADRIAIVPEAAHIQAMEVLLSKRGEGPWSSWVSFTLSRAVDRINGENIARSWDQRHALQFGFDRTGLKWDFALTGAWHSGWPTTLAFVAGTGSGATVQIGPRNGERLEDFSSLDVRLGRRFAMPRGELLVFGEVTNALKRSNPCCTRYVADLSPGLTLDPRMRHWLPLVPSVGVLWKF